MKIRMRPTPNIWSFLLSIVSLTLMYWPKGAISPNKRVLWMYIWLFVWAHLHLLETTLAFWSFLGLKDNRFSRTFISTLLLLEWSHCIYNKPNFLFLLSHLSGSDLSLIFSFSASKWFSLFKYFRPFSSPKMYFPPFPSVFLLLKNNWIFFSKYFPPIPSPFWSSLQKVFFHSPNILIIFLLHFSSPK